MKTYDPQQDRVLIAGLDAAIERTGRALQKANATQAEGRAALDRSESDRRPIEHPPTISPAQVAATETDSEPRRSLAAQDADAEDEAIAADFGDYDYDPIADDAETWDRAANDRDEFGRLTDPLADYL